MKLKRKTKIPLDQYINKALYNKKTGYYMNKDPFGKKGDYITAPNISILFSEMIAIWILSFWQNIGSPKNFNLVELGAGNGEMMKILIQSFKNFPEFFNTCNIYIHEKSIKLIKIQKMKLKKNNVSWISKINKIKKYPTIFIANEFFDSIPIKQFLKLDGSWFERYVNMENKKNFFFFNKKIDIKKFEKKIKYNISHKQNFIEYSQNSVNYLKNVCKIIKKYKGGALIIDYGYFEERMKNTLQAISGQKYSNVLKNFGNSDITHNISFYLFKNIIQKINHLEAITTNQGEFLTKIGINRRAEIISKNLSFLKKAHVYYRLSRLIDKKQMGGLFKVLFIKNKKNKFKLGF